jgi:hypothetical protein
VASSPLRLRTERDPVSEKSYFLVSRIPTMENVQKPSNSVKLSVVEVETGESASTKLQVVLKRNPGFSTFTSVCQVLNGDDVDPSEDIAPEKIPLLNTHQ